MNTQGKQCRRHRQGDEMMSLSSLRHCPFCPGSSSSNLTSYSKFLLPLLPQSILKTPILLSLKSISRSLRQLLLFFQIFSISVWNSGIILILVAAMIFFDPVNATTTSKAADLLSPKMPHFQSCQVLSNRQQNPWKLLSSSKSSSFVSLPRIVQYLTQNDKSQHLNFQHQMYYLQPKQNGIKSFSFFAADVGDKTEDEISKQHFEELAAEQALNGDADDVQEENKVIAEMKDLETFDAGSVAVEKNITSTTLNMTSIDSSSRGKSKSRWRKLSNFPGVGALLPGRPLFMRLLTMRSIDTSNNSTSQVHTQDHKLNEESVEQNETTEQQQTPFQQPDKDTQDFGPVLKEENDMGSVIGESIIADELNTTINATNIEQSSPLNDEIPEQLMNESLAEESSQATNKMTEKKQPNNYEQSRQDRRRNNEDKTEITGTSTSSSSTSGKEGSRESSRFFNRKNKNSKQSKNGPVLSKEEARCPIIITNIHELREAILAKKVPLRDVGFRFPVKGIGSEGVMVAEGGNSSSTNVTMIATVDTFEEAMGAKESGVINITTPKVKAIIKEGTTFQRHDPIINGTLSSLLTCNTHTSSSTSKTTMLRNSTSYQKGIELINLHPVLSLVRERVNTNSTPGNRNYTASSPNATSPHLALVIEGGGMRGAVSAGMAAALSTLDLLDAFDSVHGSSAGAIIGAYLVSRQLCTDVYTDIMPAAGSKFASSKRVMINVGVDWLGDLIKRKLVTSSEEDLSSKSDKNDATKDDEDELCIMAEDDIAENETDSKPRKSSSLLCEDDTSSVELAMGKISATSRRRRRWSDDHYDGVMFESANYLYSFARTTVSRPISFGIRRAASAIRPALSALDFASTMRQYLRRSPGMNITFVLDGIMDETHGLRPFDMDAFLSNDKRQPLYVVASTVSGSGDMETVAFNSFDGDFFGLSEEAPGDNASGASWYTRTWNMLKTAPYAIYSVIQKTLFPQYDDLAVPSNTEAPLLPPGTNAMFGFANRHKRKRFKLPIQDKHYEPTGRADNEGKKGLFPCLEASMLVPAAAGPPIRLFRSQNRPLLEQNKRFPNFRPRQSAKPPPLDLVHTCFDAFCYEPIPYRSAVEKAGATHVLALRSRPDGCVVETRQHIYERVVGPIYFRKHGLNKVAKLFASGGSQYRYIEDVLTLDEGLANGIAMGQNGTTFQGENISKGVKIPPTKILYGSDNIATVGSTEDWKEAHLLPITLPYGTPELPALTQDKDEVINAVRYGYAAAFDVLAPIAGLPFDSKTIPGERVAELLFPDGYDDIAILDKPVKVKPSYIRKGGEETSPAHAEEERMKQRNFAQWITGKREARRKEQEKIAAHPDGVRAQIVQRRTRLYHESDQYVRDDGNTLEWLETEALLAALPGFRGGRLDHIADSLLEKEERKKEKEK